MPSAIRLAGLVFFAILAWSVSEMTKPLLPEGTNFGRMSEYIAAIGGIMGWVLVTPRMGERMNSSISAGLTAAIATTFWSLLMVSVYAMLKQSLRMAYDGPVEAVVGVFQLMFEFGQLIATPAIIGTILIGGIVGGIFARAVAKRWPN